MGLGRWVLILMVAGCGADKSADAGGRQPAAATIEPQPFLTLGYDGAPADQPFGGISGVHRLPDGNTVIADAAQMLWFDSAGQLVRSAGSAGETRGIRRDILWMRGYRGDSVIAYDAASGDFSVWAADGSLARSFQLTTDVPLGFVLPDSPSRDGSVLTMLGPSHTQEWSDGSWSVLRLATFTPKGALALNLGTALRYPCRGPAERGCTRDFEAFQGTWTAGERGAYVARPDRADIRWVTADSVIMVRGPKQWARGRAEMIPTYSRLLVDSERYLWAQSGDGSRAALFDPLNNFIGAIDVPAQLQISQVGIDFVVGVIDEADGVGRVQIHRLHRAVAAGGMASRH